MDMFSIVLALLYFALIGWFVHRLMGHGNHGVGLLHYAFVGGAGCGVGAFVEFVTQRYTSTIAGTVGLCVICACVVEFLIRRLRHWVWLRESGYPQGDPPECS